MQLREDQRGKNMEHLKRSLAQENNPTHAARQAGVSTTTAVVCALGAGKPVSLRPKSLVPEKRRWIEALLADGKSPKEVVELSGFSSSSVYRVMCSAPQVLQRHKKLRMDRELGRRKKCWLALIARQTLLTKKQLRALDPSNFAFLYRHAREWLDEVTPVKKQRNKPISFSSRLPVGADAALAASIEEAAQRTLVERGSASRLLSLAGSRASGQLNLRNALAAKAALAQSTESPRAFVTRRLREAVAQVREDGYGLAVWRVLKVSGLRPATVYKTGVVVQVVIRSYRAERMLKVVNV